MIAMFRIINFLLLIISLFVSSCICDPDPIKCDCRYKNGTQLQINFDLDSMNGGYTVAELRKVEIKVERENGSYDIESPSVRGFSISGSCSGVQKKRIAIFDSTTNKFHLLTDFYFELVQKGCCDDEQYNSYALRTFTFDGVKNYRSPVTIKK
jgi:hypothetical protein